jgi:20S proteasome subunit beta 1
MAHHAAGTQLQQMSGGFDPTLSDVSLGTTIVAVSYDGGVILGADSRTSTGSYVANRAQDKITPLTDRVYLCRSGSASDTQAIAAHVQHYLSAMQAERAGAASDASSRGGGGGGAPSVRAAATLCMQMAYGNKNALQAGLIVAGFDHGGPGGSGGSVYAIPLGGTLLKVPYAIGGSGSAYITGFCDRRFREGMGEAEAKAFVVAALGHAIARDASSGGCIRTVTIDKDGARRDFIAGDKVPVAFGELAAAARGARTVAAAATAVATA